MSDYTPIVDFSAKDSLSTGDSNKLILGSEMDAEMAAIQTAVNSKSDVSTLTSASGTAVEVATATWTPTWTGFSSAPTGNLRYQIYGDGTHQFVIVGDDQGALLDGTSNATTMTITGIPAAIRPDTDALTPLFIMKSSGTTGFGYASASAAGTITFYAGDPPVFDGFANSSTKGLFAGVSFMYPLILQA